MRKLIWLHEDCLRETHNLFREAGAARAVFVWDDGYFKTMHYGLKRRVFIYETLCALPVDIIAGDTLDCLRRLADTADEIVTGKTPNPALKQLMEKLRADKKVTAIADAPFVQMDSPPDLKRFFKYWNKAKKRAFLFDGRP
jgi:deoxyribodipyrimidine photo-lyase